METVNTGSEILVGGGRDSNRTHKMKKMKEKKVKDAGKKRSINGNRWSEQRGNMGNGEE
jgi:hypothetical protein